MLAIRGIRFTAMGPHSAGTTPVFLADSAGNDGGAAGRDRHRPGRSGRPRRGARRRRAGGRCRAAATAEVVSVPGRRRVTGVVLAAGEEIAAPDRGERPRPRRQLQLGLVDPEVLGPRLGWQAGNLRQSGVTAKVDLALADCRRSSAG